MSTSGMRPVQVSDGRRWVFKHNGWLYQLDNANGSECVQLTYSEPGAAAWQDGGSRETHGRGALEVATEIYQFVTSGGQSEDDGDNEYAPYGSEREALDAFDEWINDRHPQVRVCDYAYDPARVFKEVDPITYRCEFDVWVDNQRSLLTELTRD